MPTDAPQPVYILVRPQMGENIGAAARGMWNFALDRMRIVHPRDGWPNDRARAMASGAGRVLDAAQICDTVTEAIADCTHVYATTARPRGMTKAVLSPERAMRDAAQRIASGEKIAILFGPERAGLENEEIAQANTIITVPVNPEYASLNLAQCVLLVAYEWRRQAAEVTHDDPGPNSDPATLEDREALAQHYEDRLEEAGFFFPPDKAPSMKTNLRNLWSRLPLTRTDVRVLHGIMRQLVRWKGRDE